MLSGPALSRFRKKLLGWFGDFQRDLPWRRTKDPYHVWLSEIMLQQTRVATAIPYYQRFLRRFPDVETLAEAPEQEVLRQWAGLGYYARARNLQKAARQIVATHRSRFPDVHEHALGLSGIGAYTAAAILSIAYGKKLAVLDGNVARVIARLCAMHGDLRTGRRWRQLQQTADSLLSPGTPGDWNQAMMELGATLCTPRSPQCLLCPVAGFCEARKKGLVELIPEKRNKRAQVQVILAAVVLVDPQGRTLLLPPPESGAELRNHVAVLLSRMWHFPTIQVRRNAAPELLAFIKTLLPSGQRLTSALQEVSKVRHTVTYRRITVLSFRLELAKLPRIAGAEMLPLADLSAVAISNLSRKVAKAALTKSIDAKPSNMARSSQQISGRARSGLF